VTQVNHNDIMHAIGRMEGRIEGIQKDIQANGEHAKAVNDKVTKLADRVSRIELWKAEIKGMSIGAKVTWGGVIAFVSAGVSIGISYIKSKVGG